MKLFVMQIQELEDKLKIAEAEIIGARVDEQVCVPVKNILK